MASLPVVTAQWRKCAWLDPRCIDVVLYAALNLSQIGTQPVISELDSCIGVGRRLGGIEQRLEHLEFIDDARQNLTFVLRIRSCVARDERKNDCYGDRSATDF